jgi:hypothetical protein
MPSFIFRPLWPICILVRTRILFALCMIWIFVCIWILDSWSRCGYYIFFLWVPSWTCIMLLPWFHPPNVYVATCTFRLVGVSKATSCELCRDCYNSQGADFGPSQVVSEPRFCRYPWVCSACRITLPMVVVESSVKNYFARKKGWIVLIRSVFYSLSLCFSPLTFASFESSLSYLLQV